MENFTEDSPPISNEPTELSKSPVVYNGFSGEGQNNSGLVGKKFPRRNLSTPSRVPVLSVLNVRSGSSNVKSVSYVLPQRNINNIDPVRNEIREQNFIREVSDYAGRVMGLRNKNIKESINIEDISSVLRSDISEDDAIYVYNILILLVLLMFIYADTYSNDPHKLNNSYIQKKILDEYKKRSITSKINNVIGEIALASMITVVSAISAPFGGPIILIAISIRSRYSKTGPYMKNRIDIRQIIMIILNLLLSDKNTIPAKNIKDKLKYWGLKQLNVDSIFDENSIFGEISRLDVTNKEDFKKIMDIASSFKFVSAFASLLRKQEGHLAPNRPLSGYLPNITLPCKESETIKKKSISINPLFPKTNQNILCPFKIVGGYRNTKKVKRNNSKGSKRKTRKL
jgi:hypothetical protein